MTTNLPVAIDLAKNEDLRLAFEFLGVANAPIAVTAGEHALVLRWRSVTKTIPLVQRGGVGNILDATALVSELSDVPIGQPFIGDLVRVSAGASNVWASLALTRREIVQATEDLGGRTVRVVRDAGATIQLSVTATGAPGANGWSIIPANVVDGERRVQQVVDWSGGGGTKPATGLYVGPTGLVADIAEATDLRGAGAGNPGNPLTSVQFNDAGAFAGDASFTFNKTTKTLAASFLALAAGVLTASSPAIAVSQEWNNAAVAFTAIEANVVDTASDAGSLLMNLRVGGGHRFSVAKNGYTLAAGQVASPLGFRSSVNSGGLSVNENGTFVGVYSNNSLLAYLNGNNWTLNSSVTLNWAPGSASSGAIDLTLRRRAAANLQLGGADAAAPVSQTTSVQNVAAGTTNTAGVNFVIQGSQGTGTGAGGSIVFQVAPAGTTGSAQNALQTVAFVDARGWLAIGNQTSSTFVLLQGRNNGGAGLVIAHGVNSNQQLLNIDRNGTVALPSASRLAWTNGDATGAADTFLARDAADTLALRNGVNAQVFNVYNTFTDASNNEAGYIGWSGNIFYVTPVRVGTGSNRAMVVGGSGASTITFATGGNRWQIDGNGHFIAVSDNTFDIGASAASRPRNIYVAGQLIAGGNILWPNAGGSGNPNFIDGGSDQYRINFSVRGAIRMNIDSVGTLTAGAYNSQNNLIGTSTNVSTTGAYLQSAGVLRLNDGATNGSFAPSTWKWPSGAVVGWVSTADGNGQPLDTILTRRGAANLRFGAADAAAPVAQTLSVQSVVAGTTNTAGAAFIIQGSQGTGTGAGGSIIFQVAPAGSTGSVQNALVNALTIAGTGAATFAYTVNVPQAGAGTGLYFSSNSGFYSPAAASVYAAVSGNAVAEFRASGLSVGLSGSVSWGNLGTTQDVFLTRDAANILALRNGTAAQIFRIYNTYTSPTIFECANIGWGSNKFFFGIGFSGGGVARSTQIQGNTIEFATGSLVNTLGWIIDASGNFTAGTDNTFDIGASGTTRPRNVFIAGYNQLSEMTAPAAPAANGVRIYAEDDGAGKTRLMARFATGAAQQIAIEP